MEEKYCNIILYPSKKLAMHKSEKQEKVRLFHTLSCVMVIYTLEIYSLDEYLKNVCKIMK